MSNYKQQIRGTYDHMWGHMRRNPYTSRSSVGIRSSKILDANAGRYGEEVAARLDRRDSRGSIITKDRWY